MAQTATVEKVDPETKDCPPGFGIEKIKSEHGLTMFAPWMYQTNDYGARYKSPICWNKSDYIHVNTAFKPQGRVAFTKRRDAVIWILGFNWHMPTGDFL